MAVVPNLPALSLHKKWTPFVEHLSRQTGTQIKLKLYDSIQAFLDACNRGEPDFIYAAPNMFYPVYQKQKYMALVRSSTDYTGVIFTRSDSPLASMNDLEGKKVAFVGPKNLCSVFVRHQLARGEIPVKVNKSFSSSTVNVAKAVLMGQADAGATLDLNFRDDFPELNDQLKIIYQSPKVASHPIAAHPRVPKAVRSRVERQILAMDRTEAGRTLLQQIGFPHPVKANTERDYSIFRDIDDSRL